MCAIWVVSCLEKQHIPLYRINPEGIFTEQFPFCYIDKDHGQVHYFHDKLGFSSFWFSDPVFYYRGLENILWLVTCGMDVLWTLVHQATNTCLPIIIANILQWMHIVFPFSCSQQCSYIYIQLIPTNLPPTKKPSKETIQILTVSTLSIV